MMPMEMMLFILIIFAEAIFFINIAAGLQEEEYGSNKQDDINKRRSKRDNESCVGTAHGNNEQDKSEGFVDNMFHSGQKFYMWL